MPAGAGSQCNMLMAKLCGHIRVSTSSGGRIRLHAPGSIPVERRGFGQTMRRDAWWAQPLLTFTVLGAFVVFMRRGRRLAGALRVRTYLSPFYSPLLYGRRPQLVWPEAWLVAGGAAVLRRAPDSLGAGFPLHVLLLPRRLLQGVLGRPAVVRCRRAAQRYLGEQSFPLILQNIHRYFLYLAILFRFRPTTSGRRCGSLMRAGR